MIEEAYVVFEIDGQSCAVPLGSVRRIVRAAALSPVPDAPSGLLGLLNLHGRLVPIFDVRLSLGYPPKPLSPADRFVIVNNGMGSAGIRVDEVCHIGKVETESTDQCRRLFEPHSLFGAVGQCDGKTVLLMDPASLGKKAHGSVKAVKGNNGEVMNLTHGEASSGYDREAVEACL